MTVYSDWGGGFLRDVFVAAVNASDKIVKEVLASHSFLQKLFLPSIIKKEGK